MLKYTIKSFLGMLPTMFIIITISFFLIKLAPGSPLDREQALPDAVRANLEAKYGLDDPLYVQYFTYLKGILVGDFGPSTTRADFDATYYIAKGLPASALLGFLSLGVSLILGVLAGMYAAVKQNRFQDYLVMSISVIGITVPAFVAGPLLIYAFAFELGWLPTSGWITSDPSSWVTLILPVTTLALTGFGGFARLTRGAMLDILKGDYIRTAKSKGLSNKVILYRHCMKPLMVPIASITGPSFAYIVTGSIVVETLFRVPGVGVYFVQSATNRDYFLLLATVILFAFAILIMNFIVDVVYGFLDPRITYK